MGLLATSAPRDYDLLDITAQIRELIREEVANALISFQPKEQGFYSSYELPRNVSKRTFNTALREGRVADAEVLGTHPRNRWYRCSRAAWEASRGKRKVPLQTELSARQPAANDDALAEEILLNAGLRLPRRSA